MTGQLRWFRWWLAVGLFGCGMLLYLSLIPSPPQPEVAHFDKLEHLLAYIVLGAWFAAILPRHHGRVFVGLAVLGGLIELLQGMTDYRSGDALDMVADVVGIVVGILAARAGMMRWVYRFDEHVLPDRNRT